MTWADLAHGSIRGLHVAAAMAIFGTALLRAVSAPAALARCPTAMGRSLDHRLIRLAWASFAVAAIAGGFWLLMESADLAPDMSASSVLSTIPIVLWQTHFGLLLSSRLAILLVACILFMKVRGALPAAASARPPAGLVAGLSGLAVALQAGLGHGISMAGATGAVLTSTETIHLLSAGAWLGGLPGLFILVRSLPAEIAGLAVRRFSHLALACVILLVVTILIQGWVLIGGLPGLIGTAYGRVALMKAGLLVALLGLAALNRFRFVPALAGGVRQAGRRPLLRSIAIESAIGLVAIMAAGLLLTLPPAMHVQPDWPFARRFSLDALDEPFLRAIVLSGAGELLGAAALLVVAIRFARLRWIGIGLAVGLAWFGLPNLRLLFVPAYPTSFYRSPSGFTSASVTRGASLFQKNCTGCHGVQGRGDGPLAKSLAIPPADLTAAHLFGHSDGELFWWLTHGIAGLDGNLAMPGFSEALDPDQRWNLIDYIRARNVGLAVSAEGQWTRPMRAPDASVLLAGKPVALSTLRGRAIRIIVLSADGGQAPPPLAPDSDLPITSVTLTADSDAGSAYSIVSGTPLETLAGSLFLVDSQGWLRGLFRAGPAGTWPDARTFMTAARAAERNPIADPAGGGMSMNMNMQH
jgi:putative copper export protein/mono/diheme cytochrome c family protein